MANWKKVLVSGSNIEVNNILGNVISGSKLNLSGLGGSANDVLIINGEGSITTLAQGSLSGASQTFTISANTGTPEGPSNANTSFNANTDILLLTTASNHGFSFTVGEGVPGITTASLVTPQDLRISATPRFANIDIDGDIRHNADTDTKISFADNLIRLQADSSTIARARVTNADTPSDRDWET